MGDISEYLFDLTALCKNTVHFYFNVFLYF